MATQSVRASDAFIAQKVKQKSDITLHELIPAVADELGKKVSITVIQNSLMKRLNFTRKKSFCYPEKDIEITKQKRREFVKIVASLSLSKLVFIDETGIHLAMSRTYGRSKK